MITVKSNIADVAKQFRAYPEKVVKRATSRSINESLTSTRAEFARHMAAEADVPRSVARASTTLKRSTARTLTGELNASGDPIAIRAYGARKTATGVRAKVRGQIWNIDGAFRLKSKGNHWFKRSTEKRMPIYRVTGPPLPLNVTETRLKMLRIYSLRKFAERMSRNVKFYLQRKKV